MGDVKSVTDDFRHNSEVCGATCNLDNVSSKNETIPHGVSEQISFFFKLCSSEKKSVWKQKLVKK